MAEDTESKYGGNRRRKIPRAPINFWCCCFTIALEMEFWI